MLLQEQEGVANALGLTSADALMRQVSGAARTISWASDDTWRRVESYLAGPGGRVASTDRVMSPGVVLRDDEIVIAHDACCRIRRSPVRVAAASAQTGAPIGRATLERLRAEAAAPGDPWPAGPPTRSSQLLATGTRDPGLRSARPVRPDHAPPPRMGAGAVPAATQSVSPLHRRPAPARGDRGSGRAAERVSRPDLLLVAAWLHDLGKGYPGDHTTVGVELMQRIATRMGFAAPDVEILVRLVREHLLLADAATRRDIQDPVTLTQVAEAVCDLQTLELLAALTEADSKATGDSAWSDWKAGLIAELVERVADVLEGRQPVPRATNLEPALQALVDASRRRSPRTREPIGVVVVAPDRPGLFCQLRGRARAARPRRARGRRAVRRRFAIAVDEFRVQPTHDNAPDWNRFRDNVVKVLDGRLALEARLADGRARATRRASQRRPCSTRRR